MPALETVIVTLGVAALGLAVGALIGTIFGRAIYDHPIKFEGPSDDAPDDIRRIAQRYREAGE